MVHDEMVTEPPWTKTPPPCKQRAKRESPMRAMGNFRCRWHVLQESVVGAPTIKDESRFGLVSKAFPLGLWGMFKVSVARTSRLSKLDVNAVLE
jgi:hypothetical protein